MCDRHIQCESHASHITWPFFDVFMRKTLCYNVNKSQKQTIFCEFFKNVEFVITSNYNLLYWYLQVAYLQFYTRSHLMVHTTLCDKVCQWLATGGWFFPGTLVSSTNKNDRHDITEILLKVALNTITTTMYWSETELEVNTADCWPVTRPIQNYHLIISLFINYWLRIGFFWFFFC